MAKLIFTDGENVKSINPWDLDSRPEAWTVIGGKKTLKETDARLVSTVFAALDARYKAAADTPFTIYGKGDKPVDDSDDYQNAVKFLPNPSLSFGLAELSLATTGSSYFFTGKNEFKITKGLQYWVSDTVTPIYNDKSGELLSFKRKENNKETSYKVDDVLYMWLPDEQVETGPPSVWPLAAALVSASALSYINLFVRDYMQRGAVKAMILAVDGNPPPDETKRIEAWFNTFMRGARNAAWKVFNMEAIKPTIIGEGLEALKDLSIKTGLKEDILEALGVPSSLLATESSSREGNARKEDGRFFYTNTIIPDLRLIQFAFNEQVLHTMNYHLQFEPERLEAFQVDEATKVTALSSLLTAIDTSVSPDKLKVAIEISGLTVTEEQMAVLTKAEPKVEEPLPNQNGLDEQQMKEIGQWQRNALRVGGAKSAAAFEARYLPADMVAEMKAELTLCKDKDAIKAVFAKVRSVPTMTPAHEYKSDIFALAEAINKVVEGMK